jgi:hypothetical protein
MEVFDNKQSWIKRLYHDDPEQISFHPIQITNYLYRKLDQKSRGSIPLDPFRLMEILKSEDEKVYFLYYDKNQRLIGFAIVTIIDQVEDAGITVHVDFAVTPFKNSLQFYQVIEKKIIDLLFYDYFFIVFRIHPVNDRIFNMLLKKMDYSIVGDPEDNNLIKIIEFTPKQQ